MPDSPHPSPKAQIRSRLLAARRALPEPVRRDADRAVQAAITGMFTGTGGWIAGYVPFGTEPGGADLPGVLARALGPGGRLLVPVLREDRDLDWAEYGEDWPAPGEAGQGSNPRLLGRVAIRRASLVVVPAVAVDRRGIRLGRGGGSYDRALARVAPGVEVVALLHDGELLDDPLPADPHDQAVTAVVTPSLGLLRLSPPAGSPLPSGTQDRH